ncbi:MAG: hypothetical protein ABRQ32_08855 [Smithellaceae bacterium]
MRELIALRRVALSVNVATEDPPACITAKQREVIRRMLRATPKGRRP